MSIFDTEVQLWNLDVNMVVPPTGRFQVIFEFYVDVENKREEKVNLMFTVRESQGTE
jgi:hypothetical protein